MKHRRTIGAFSLAGIILVAFILSGCRGRGGTASPSQKELVVVSWGGELQKAERAAFFDPFQARTRVTVRDLPYTGEYAKIKAQVHPGRVEWDVCDVDSDIVLSGGRDGILEPIDYSIVPRGAFLPGLAGTNGVGFFFVSTALTWNSSRLPAGTPPPTSWKDLWDLKRYPGKRGLRKDPRTTLEIALMADGVPMDKLYPLDVDRALHKLSEIKDHIVWWSSGSEYEQKILADYTLASGWNGRAILLQRQGKPIGLSLNQGVLEADWLVVPKGTPRKKLAMEFIAQVAQPEGQKVLAEKMAYGPVNPQAAASLPMELRHVIPTSPENLNRQVQMNAEWWASHEKELRAKWETWLLR